MAINNELFSRVRNHILEEPRRYEQTSFGQRVPAEVSPCGTQACILGWAVILDGRLPMDANFDDGDIYFSVEKEGREALGLTRDEADAIAYGGWPEPFKSRYRNATYEESTETPAQVAADYLDHIIATGRVTE
jgi:hypothetical protein